MTNTIFYIGLGVNIVLLMVLFLSIKTKRFLLWPPPRKQSWQYHLVWWSIRTVVACICVVLYLDWGSLGISDFVRLYIACPLFVLAFAGGSVAARQLGWSNTHGIAERFVESGLYRFSRNPQYVLYAFSFVCLGVWAASLPALILLLLLAAWYLSAPFPEERWLESRYGEQYREYKLRVPRYF